MRRTQENMHVGRGVEALLLSLIIWSGVDVYCGSNCIALISSITIFFVDLLSTEFLLHHKKLVKKQWLRYYFCCIYGLAFAIVFAYTKYPSLLAFAFIGNALVIIYHDLVYTVFSLSAIVVVVFAVLKIKIELGTISLIEALLCVFIVLNDVAIWFFTNKMQTYFVNADKATIVEQEKTQREAEEESKAKSNFLANMSHEIRTPMNAICGMTELLLQLELKPVELEYVSTINSSSKILLDIINDVLDFSKLDFGKMELIEDEYNLTSSINDIQGIISSRIGAKDIAFTININPDIPVKLCGDEVRIRQILLNLLNNAVKFTTCGEIRLNVDFERGYSLNQNVKNIKLIIEVSDTGIGIKEEDLDVLFEAFYQVDMRKNRSIEGTGLGLAIAKRLAQLMNGDISVTSSYGKGSTFKVTLQQKVVDASSVSKFEEAEKNEMLIFEPNPYYAMNLQQILDSLHIKNKRIGQLEELNTYQFVKPSKYILFDYKAGIGFMNQYQNSHEEVVCIAMLDSNVLLETSTQDKMLLTHKPISLYSMVSLLNGEYHSNIQGKKLNSFIAPEAKVLVVDDNSFNLKVASGFLQAYRVQVTLAMSGKEAIDKVKAYPEFDIIFMDHMMPEMDGIEATKQIRSLGIEYVKKVPIIALTANAIKGVEKMFLEHGMDDFLAKPIEIKRLAKIMKKWIPKEKQLDVYTPSQEKPIVQEKEEDKLGAQIIGIDTKLGIKNCMGNIKLYKEILHTFLTSTTNDKESLQKAFEKQDLKNYMIYSHGLKSASRSVGAVDISECAEFMENACRNNEWSIIEEKHEEFMAKLDSVLGVLSLFLKTDMKQEEASEEKQVEDSYSWQDFLQKCYEAAQDYDMEALEQCVSKVLRKQFTLKQQKTFTEIEKLVKEFKYEEIEELTRQVLEE